MDTRRSGEIALALVQLRLTQEGFAPNQNFRREIGHLAKLTGIPFAEMLEFFTDQTTSLTKQALGDSATPPTDEEISEFRDGHGGRFGRRGAH